MTDSQHPNDDVLIDVAMQLVEAEAEQAILRHIGSCQPCEARFHRLAAEWELAAVRADEIRRRPRATSGSHHLLTWVGSIASRPITRWVAAAATLVVLLITLAPQLWKSAPQSALTVLPELTSDVLQRAALPESDSARLKQAMNAYKHGNYEDAVAALSAMETIGPVEALRRVYLASALAWIGRYQDAIDTLDPAPLYAVPDPWSAEAKWTLYVCLMKTAQTDRAQRVLDDLARMPGEAGDRARELSR